jgi:predicted nucleotidyltransferase
MAVDELVRNGVERIGDREIARLRAELGQEDALEDEVAEFLAEGRAVVMVERLEHLVSFFEDERAERLERLLAVPGAAPRGPQFAHEVHEPGERGGGV